MRNSSVSRTRAGPMATPGETAMPLLISMDCPADGKRSTLRRQWLVGRLFHSGACQHFCQHVDGILGIWAGNLQKQLSPLLRGQQHELQRTLAVDALVILGDGDRA